MPRILPSSFHIDTLSLPDHVVLDDPKRLNLAKSKWNFVPFGKKSKMDNEIKKDVIKLFQTRYHFEDSFIFNRVWNEIGAEIWTPASPLTAGTLRAIDAAFKAKLIYHGPGIKVPKARNDKTDPVIQMVVNAIFHGGAISWKPVNKTVVKTLLIKNNPTLMKDFRQELQGELDNIAANLPTNSSEEFLWKRFLGFVLAILPYSYPSTGDIIAIPFLKDGVCRKVNYTIEVIPLSLTSLATPMIALGLTPVDDKESPPILAYLGTTFPGGDGFAATILSDFTPGHSVGEAIYQQNRHLIDKWLEGKKEVHAIGTSLGGALVLNTIIDHQDKITHVEAYVPAGLYPSKWKEEISNNSKVNIYCQPNDIVSQLGSWPRGNSVSLYSIIPEQEGVKENPISSHVRTFTGCEKVTIIKKDPQKDNLSFWRRLITILHQFLGPLVVFLPASLALLLYRLLTALHRIGKMCLKLLKL